MKKLYFLRHAKSANPSGIDDKNRPINPQGVSSCGIMREYIIANHIVPGLVLCSDAIRTRQTAEEVFKGQNNLNIEYNKQLYLATPREIIKEIAKTSDKLNSLMIIAHNPGIQEICTMLAGKGNLEILQYIKNDYPTCALTEFSFNIEKWNKIEPRGGTLENFILPKEL